MEHFDVDRTKDVEIEQLSKWKIWTEDTVQKDGDFGLFDNELQKLLNQVDSPEGLRVQYNTLGRATEGIVNSLHSNIRDGLSGDSDDLTTRKQVFGSNVFRRKEMKRFWVVWEASYGVPLLILIVCAAALCVLGILTKGMKIGWDDGSHILAAIAFIIMFTGVTDCMMYGQIECTYRRDLDNMKLVIRAGKETEIMATEVVVGDVVSLRPGEEVPADGILIVGSSLILDELISGKYAVPHNADSPYLIGGSRVASGSGKMLVTSVGTKTKWGTLRELSLNYGSEETPLQVKLNGTATCICWFAIAYAVIFLVVLFLRCFTGYTRNGDGNVQFLVGSTKAIHVSYLTVQILSYSVRRLSACEVMGRATKICLNKTGTLTDNEMEVIQLHAGGQRIQPVDVKSLISPPICALSCQSIATSTCGYASFPKGNQTMISGSPMEKAILCWGIQIGMDFPTIKSNSEIISWLPFTPEMKCSGVAVKSGDEIRGHWIGAAEVILKSCTTYMNGSKAIQMSEDKLLAHNNKILEMAKKGLICIAFAYADDIKSEDLKLPESNLSLLAIVGIKDPCRFGMKDAVQKCINAGIKVCMVTGDHIETAKAVAYECGILQTESQGSEANVVIDAEKFVT